jgi:anthranilate/para-aminobenzoate synthase component I
MNSQTKSIICTHGKLYEYSDPSSIRVYYKDKCHELISNQTFSNSLLLLKKRMDSIALASQSKTPQVWHFSYELGFLFNELEEFLPEEKILCVCIEYQNSRLIELSLDKVVDLQQTSKHSYKDYEQKFRKVYSKLKLGEAYQVNLTERFRFKLKGKSDFESLVSQLFRHSSDRGAYAHATHIDELDFSFLSNSPECLFQVKESKFLETMPIKGTVKFEGEDFEQSWKELVNDVKNEGELNMITDLMRNDLAKVHLPRVKILKAKAPLIVPKLLHQYSHLQTKLDDRTSLYKVMSCLFPGGSITGAPKKNVMRIIHEAEGSPRGFYCGSTLVRHETLNAASINIRSSEVYHNHLEMIYGSGGGITLLSRAKSEYVEMLRKVESFVGLINKEQSYMAECDYFETNT